MKNKLAIILLGLWLSSTSNASLTTLGSVGQITGVSTILSSEIPSQSSSITSYSSAPVVLDVSSISNPSTSSSSFVPNSVALSSAPVISGSIPSLFTGILSSSAGKTSISSTSAGLAPVSSSVDASSLTLPVGSSLGAFSSGVPSGSAISLPLVGIGGWVAGIFTPTPMPNVNPTGVTTGGKGAQDYIKN